MYVLERSFWHIDEDRIFVCINHNGNARHSGNEQIHKWVCCSNSGKNQGIWNETTEMVECKLAKESVKY